MRRTTTLLVGLGLLTLTLTACNGSADPPAPSPTPTAASTSATPTPPTPPAMPEAAKAHTKAGAKAFVEYFWEVVNYAQATGDTDAIRRLSADGCTGCKAGISSIRDVYDAGGVIVGGRSSLSDLHVKLRSRADTDFATIEYVNRIDAQTSDYPGASRDKRTEPRTFHDRLNLIAVGGGLWTVATFEVLP